MKRIELIYPTTMKIKVICTERKRLPKEPADKQILIRYLDQLICNLNDNNRF